MRLAALTTAAVIATVVAIPRADADDDDDAPIVERMRFVERGDLLHVTADIKNLFDVAAYQALDSGFTSTVLIRLWIYARDSTKPIAAYAIERQVLYNLWDEVYELRFEYPGGKKFVFKEKRKAEALKRLTRLDDIPVAHLADLPHDKVFLLAMEVQLNPVSEATLTQVRRWLSQGTGGGLDRGGAFFGSFVSVFVNPKIPEADRAVRIRSQPFFRPHR